jgi:uncharacterized integral membrane protein
MPLFRRQRGGLDEFQPRLWLILIGLLAIAAYVIAFIVMNDKEIEIEFVFFTASISLIWEILLMLVIGVLGGVLLSQIYRRRGREQPGEPPDRLS